jgi:hypothetical protein
MRDNQDIKDQLKKVRQILESKNQIVSEET